MAHPRPYAPPPSPWVMSMRWSRLLFMHWRVPEEALRPHVPPMLEIDTFDGSAWIAVVPFTMSGVRARCTPALPGPGAFHELNVRTYVRYKDKPGVWFFSLDAANALAVEVARRTFRLAYFSASMRLIEDKGTIEYASKRTDRRGAPATLRCRYGADGPAEPTRSGSLEAFLTERYRLFSSELPPQEPRRLWVGEIDHEPWMLSRAWCETSDNSMASALRLRTPSEEALLHMAMPIDVRAWWPRRLV